MPQSDLDSQRAGSPVEAVLDDETSRERHHEEQRRSFLRLSYRERLRWLEEAKRFAKTALEAARKRRSSPAR